MLIEQHAALIGFSSQKLMDDLVAEVQSQKFIVCPVEIIHSSSLMLVDRMLSRAASAVSF